MYELLLHRNAAKAYENLDNRTVARINKSIDVLKENPFYGKDIKKLRGELGGRCGLGGVILCGKKVCYEGYACLGYMLGCMIREMVRG